MGYEIRQRDNGVCYLEFSDENRKRVRRSLKAKNRRHADKFGRDLYISLHTGQDDIEVIADLLGHWDISETARV